MMYYPFKPLNPDVNIQILLTDLYTFLIVCSWENLMILNPDVGIQIPLLISMHSFNTSWENLIVKPFSPDVNIQILLTGHYAFLIVLVGRI